MKRHFPTKGLVCWYIASDAMIGKDNVLIYWPNRANRFWKIKKWWAILKNLLGNKDKRVLGR